VAPRDPHLLLQPAGTVVRHLARQLLEEAQAAAARLDGNDPEALHDFRVAVRRLRTLLRAWEETAQVPPKTTRRLRKLARATNEARDLEVALENLRRRADAADSAAAALTEHLARRHALIRNETVDEVKKEWPALAARLHRALAANPAETAPSFRQAASQLLAAEWDGLQEVLDALRTRWEDDTAHRARLAGKRLRYLLEPLSAELPVAKEAVATLKRFQDRFGLYHDLWVLVGLLAEEAAASAAVATHARACGRPAEGLITERYLVLADGLHAERNRLADQLAADYLAPAARALEPVAAAVTALTSG
jgi:CHAD domain-containing protein